MKVLTIFFILILLSGFTDCSKKSTEPVVDDTFYINLSPQNNTIAIGDNIVLKCRINSVEDLFAVVFDITFDTAFVKVDTVIFRDSGLLGENTISFYSNITEGISVSVGKTQTTNNDNVSGNGELFEVTFTGIYQGVSEIDFENIIMVDEEGVSNPDIINLEIRSSEIIVQ
ncbi:MAG: hypothetical protein GY855_01090 [candidate division Zixibacteria bacterium]|nr:hypothetical protein [candidate division Zixibacteria bacterium]